MLGKVKIRKNISKHINMDKGVHGPNGIVHSEYWNNGPSGIPMKQVGVEHVRGGSWTTTTLLDLEKMIATRKDLCYHCHLSC
jgi:hypothetical protein